MTSLARFFLPLFIGLRYNRASSKQRFLSLLSWVSLLGIILGVAALIIVLSVMNGFRAELRDRMLAVIPHGQIERQDGKAFDNWHDLEKQLKKFPDVVATAPWVGGDVMLSVNGNIRAVELQGINMGSEEKIAHLPDHIVSGDIDDFSKVRYPIILGSLLAHSLDLDVGDKVTLILPKITITPIGAIPRIRQFTVVALFEVGAEMDITQAYIPLRDAQKLYSTGNRILALRYLTKDALSSLSVVAPLQAFIDKQQQGMVVSSWTQKRQSLFSAIQMEKIMVTFMLSLIIVVAAFNLISVLSMMVSEKRGEIAVLRMMGLSRAGIMKVFLTQGLSLAFVGLLIGTTIGVIVALNLTELIHWIEKTFGFYIFDPRVFYVSGLPSVLMWQDVVYVFILSILLSIIFTAYPAYRASQVQAVEALQYQ